MEENSGYAQIMQYNNGCYTSVIQKGKLQGGYKVYNSTTSLCSTEPALNMAMQMPFQDDHAYQNPANTVISWSHKKSRKHRKMTNYLLTKLLPSV